MATNITAAEVRHAGGWTSTEQPDARLESAAFILAGDGWLTEVLEANGLTTLAALTTSDANRGALAKAAEIFYVASLVAAQPAKDDFQTGPVRSSSVKNSERKALSDYLLTRAKEMLSKAGLFVDRWSVSHAGGNDYHPEGNDDTNIDFGLAGGSVDYPFNIMGAEES